MIGFTRIKRRSWTLCTFCLHHWPLRFSNLCVFFITLTLVGCSSVRNEVFILKEKGYRALVCSPKKGPFPLPMIIFHHGMVVDLHGVIEARRRGYEMTSFCKILAEDGYIAFLPIRSGLEPLKRQIGFIHKTFDYAKQIKNVDPGKIALIGFSRGALLTLMAAQDGLNAKAFTLLAPAPGPTNELLRISGKVGGIRAPIQILVVSGDHPSILTGSKLLAQSLNHAKITVDYRMLNLDKIKCRLDIRATCAHQNFYRVGPYWSIIRRFLVQHVK